MIIEKSWKLAKKFQYTNINNALEYIRDQMIVEILIQRFN